MKKSKGKPLRRTTMNISKDDLDDNGLLLIKEEIRKGTRIFKIGKKEKHITCDEKWERVHEGFCIKGDMFLSLLTGQWQEADDTDDVGDPFDAFSLLIRDPNKKIKNWRDGLSVESR
jgi:hypothetical protein